MGNFLKENADTKKEFSFCCISFHFFRKSEWQESHFKRFLYKAIFWTEHRAHKYVTSHGDEWKCLENRRLTISAHNLADLKLLSATQQFVIIRQQAFHGEIKTRIIDSKHLLLCERGTLPVSRRKIVSWTTVSPECKWATFVFDIL